MAPSDHLAPTPADAAPDPERSEAASFTVRRASSDDRAAVLGLATRALGWDPDAPNEAFFAWKHDQNPFGPSPLWLAFDGDRLAGFRIFLRWRFRWEVGAAPLTVTAVRAVDTATDPDYQRRGIFSLLTRRALEGLRDERTGFVFNTPNDKSRPGYLKMGWEVVGRVPLAVRVSSVGGATRLAGARVPAAKWSDPVAAGDEPPAALSATSELAELLDESRPIGGLVTDRTVDYVRWRYGFGPLHYRVFTLGSSLREGFLVARVRRRGPARELAIVDLVTRHGDRPARRALLRSVRRAVPHDYAVLVPPLEPVTPAGDARSGFVPAPGLGPVLTARPVTVGRPPTPYWNLSLGDVELF